MMKSILVFNLFLFIGSHGLFAQQGETIYKTYCAGCHGAQLQGNTAAKLIKTEWKYGRGRDAIVRNIRYGIASTEMIKWGGTLKDEEIDAVADYIITAQMVSPRALRPIPERLTTKDYVLKVEKLVTKDIHTPWGIEFVDANRALITERTGNIRWMVDGHLDPRPVQGLPKTFARNTGGFMDIALDPAYLKNGWVYLAFSQTPGNATDENALGMTKVVRGKIKDHQWMEEQTLFEVAENLKLSGGNRWA